jgi:hypothetical protein
VRALCGMAVVALSMALGLALASTVADQHFAGQKNCEFIPPADWHGGAISWHGQCRDGKAHGQGVMRSYRKGAAPLLFYGELEHGQLHRGVIEASDGYLAGRFSEGRLVPEPERHEVIRAFRSASAAAKAFSLRLKHDGNASSAGFYLKKSQELARQMD